MADIKFLKTGQSYTFTKANTSLEVIDGNLQNIEYSIRYIASKDANGNITVKNQNNGDIAVYNSNGEPILSETDNGLFGQRCNFGKIRTYDDYLNNVQTLDLSEADFNYSGGINEFLSEVSKQDGAAVYNSNGNFLFSCERGGYDEPDIFKGDNGQNLTKKQVEDLIRNNKLSKIEIKDAFDLRHVQEYHTLVQDIKSPF